MEPRLSVITIGAINLSAMRSFYTEILGWQPVVENQDMVFYKFNGFLLSLFDRKALSDFIGIPFNEHGKSLFTLAYNVRSKEEVMELYYKLKSVNVHIIKEPMEPPFGGLFFYFSDVEGNILEVAYNPYTPLDDTGNVITHKSIEGL
ncbi:VOC family protein [Rhodocytophaga rosea]|uniref:VOC family protein n=1 Tax=Rhodocytophaga rosea TaxID=2704465 RepID=A0A6C0GM79_9BACT|nr:VOC family protein [Rhodocytophaga rosea]QHT69146.1 VOC family protein [Rhodocytophaga rosea]